MTDAELYIAIQRGHEAEDLLEQREAAARRAKRARTPLTPARVLAMSMAGAYYVTQTEDETLQALYCGVPVDELLAACPIPKGAMTTPAEAYAVLRSWDEYIDRRRERDA